jgi:hypothetical protein
MSPRLVLAAVAFLALLAAGVVYVIIVLQNMSARPPPPIAGSTEQTQVHARELRFRRTGLASTAEYEYEFEVNAVGTMEIRIPSRGNLPYLRINSLVSAMLCCSTNSRPGTCRSQTVTFHGEGGDGGGYAYVHVKFDDAPTVCRLAYGMRI